MSKRARIVKAAFVVVVAALLLLSVVAMIVMIVSAAGQAPTGDPRHGLVWVVMPVLAGLGLVVGTGAAALVNEILRGEL